MTFFDALKKIINVVWRLLLLAGSFSLLAIGCVFLALGGMCVLEYHDNRSSPSTFDYSPFIINGLWALVGISIGGAICFSQLKFLWREGKALFQKVPFKKNM